MSVKVYYDPSTNGFYQSDINKNIPSSAIEIPDALRWKLLEGLSQQKEIAVGDNKEVYLVEKQIDEEEVKFQESLWISAELQRAGEELNKVQDADPKASGTVSQWRQYRKDIRAWPEHKDFPNKEKRPVPPDA